MKRNKLLYITIIIISYLFFAEKSYANIIDNITENIYYYEISALYLVILILVIIFLKKKYTQKSLLLQKNLEENNYLLANINILDFGYIIIDYNQENKLTISPKFANTLYLAKYKNSLNDIVNWFDNDQQFELIDIIKNKIDKKIKLTKTTSSYKYYYEVYSKYNDTNNSMIIYLNDNTEQEIKNNNNKIEYDNLKKNIKKLSMILNSAPFPIWHRNNDLQIQYCNLEYSRIIEESDIKIGDIENLELYKGAPKFAKQVLNSGQGKQNSKYIIDAGKRIFYKIWELPLENNLGLVGFAINMQELDQVKKELKLHISAQSELLESSSNATAIYGPDTRLAYYNQSFVRLTTLEEKWLETNPTYTEILDAMRLQRVLPEQVDFKQFKNKQLELFHTIIDSSYNEFFYLPDGRTLRMIVLPHALGGLLFSYEDITDYLALETSYKTLYEVNKATIDNLYEAVAVFGSDGRLKLSNLNYIKLWDLDPNFVNNSPHINDIIEMSRHLYINNTNTEIWQNIKGDLISNTFSNNIHNIKMELANGKVLNRMSIPLPDGAVLVTFLDITDSTLVERSLRERNEALTSTDKIKSEFLSNVSYELRVPLTTIIGFSEIMLKETYGKLNDKQAEYTKGVYRASQLLLNLINDILDIISIESGEIKLDIKTFTVKDSLENVIEMINYRIEECGHSLKLKCDSKLGDIKGDERRFKQVMFKLLINAIKYTPYNGKLVIQADAINDNEIKISVQDNGIGIPEEEQKYVFDKFYKTKKSAQFNKSGTGLGLALAKSFTELQDGRVELFSVENKGTTVTCYFKRNPSEKNIEKIRYQKAKIK